MVSRSLPWTFRKDCESLEKKETQAQTAKAIDVTDRQYQRFEAGENLPGLDNLCALADHFDVGLDYLARRTDER